MATNEYEDRSGWPTFAAILMFYVGFVRIVSAIRYFDDGQEINNLSAGLLGNRSESQANAQDNFCSSVGALESSVESLTSLSPTSAWKDDYESAVSDVQSDWDQVKSDAGDLKDANTSTLDSAWDDFKSALDDVPDDASVSDALGDISQAAESLASTTKSTLTGPDCSSS